MEPKASKNDYDNHQNMIDRIVKNIVLNIIKVIDRINSMYYRIHKIDKIKDLIE